MLIGPESQQPSDSQWQGVGRGGDRVHRWWKQQLPEKQSKNRKPALWPPRHQTPTEVGDRLRGSVWRRPQAWPCLSPRNLSPWGSWSWFNINGNPQHGRRQRVTREFGSAFLFKKIFLKHFDRLGSYLLHVFLPVVVCRLRGAWALCSLQHTGSLGEAFRLSSGSKWVYLPQGRVGSSFPCQGSNPCPLHWTVDPQPLDHQGSIHQLSFSLMSLCFSFLDVLLGSFSNLLGHFFKFLFTVDFIFIFWNIGVS